MGVQEFAADPDQYPLGSGLDHAGWHNRVLGGQRGLHLFLINTEGGHFLGREIQIDRFFAVAKDHHIARVIQLLHFAADVLDHVAHFARGEPVRGKGIDIAVNIAKAVVEFETGKFGRKFTADIAHHIADFLPDRRDLRTTGGGQQVYINDRHAGPCDGFGEVQLVHFQQFLFDPVGDLIQRFLHRCPGQGGGDHHGFDGEIRVFLAADGDIGHKARQHADDHQIPDKRFMLQRPVGQIETFAHLPTRGPTICPSLIEWMPLVRIS